MEPRNPVAITVGVKTNGKTSHFLIFFNNIHFFSNGICDKQ